METTIEGLGFRVPLLLRMNGLGLGLRCRNETTNGDYHGIKGYAGATRGLSLPSRLTTSRLT